jgi:hypothetical protein
VATAPLLCGCCKLCGLEKKRKRKCKKLKGIKRLDAVALLICVASGVFSLVANYPLVVEGMPRITLLSYFVLASVFAGLIIINLKTRNTMYLWSAILMACTYGTVAFATSFLFQQEDIFTVPLLFLCLFGTIFSLYFMRK